MIEWSNLVSLPELENFFRIPIPQSRLPPALCLTFVDYPFLFFKLMQVLWVLYLGVVGKRGRQRERERYITACSLVGLIDRIRF
jgi:hypothetical protein